MHGGNFPQASDRRVRSIGRVRRAWPVLAVLFAGVVALGSIVDGQASARVMLASSAATPSARVARSATGDLAGVGSCDARASGYQPGCPPAALLKGAWDTVVSPDGRNVYLVSRSADALVGFARDASTG